MAASGSIPNFLKNMNNFYETEMEAKTKECILDIYYIHEIEY